jgi:hypothetical protein
VAPGGFFHDEFCQLGVINPSNHSIPHPLSRCLSTPHELMVAGQRFILQNLHLQTRFKAGPGWPLTRPA